MSERSRALFEPIKKERLSEKVCDEVRSKLISGQLKPGDRLPPERELAIELGVSRPAVREALKTLEVSGLVELRKGLKGGAYIRPHNLEMLTRSISDLVSFGHVSLQSLAEARSLIHDVVIRLACERAQESDFLALEANVRKIALLAEAGDLEHRKDATIDFFRLIAHATRNEVLEALVDALASIIRFAVLDRAPPAYRSELVPIRHSIVAALRTRDPNVASAEMAHYLDIVHRFVPAKRAQGAQRNRKLKTTRPADTPYASRKH